MGRGSAYNHEYFMLIDDEFCEEWDIDEFKDNVIEIFNLFPTNNSPYYSRESSYIGIDENDTFYIGLDWSGGLPCIFAERYVSDYYDEEVDGELPDIDAVIVNGFNKLISFYEEETFRYPTSAWTSEIYRGTYR